MKPVEDGNVDIDYLTVGYLAFPQGGGVSCVCHERGVKVFSQLLIFPVGLQGTTDLIRVDPVGEEKHLLSCFQIHWLLPVTMRLRDAVGVRARLPAQVSRAPAFGQKSRPERNTRFRVCCNAGSVTRNRPAWPAAFLGVELVVDQHRRHDIMSSRQLSHEPMPPRLGAKARMPGVHL